MATEVTKERSDLVMTSIMNFVITRSLTTMLIMNYWVPSIQTKLFEETILEICKFLGAI